MTFVARLENLTAREREHEMLEAIGAMARGEILPSMIEREDDLRQFAYLAALSRTRVSTGGEVLSAFLKDALARLDGTEVPSDIDVGDPLQELLGARWPLDAGKVRAEADLHIQVMSVIGADPQ